MKGPRLFIRGRLLDMDSIPDEILVDVLDYLEPHDVVSAQRVSPRLLKIARDNAIWRYKCFESAPSAANINASRLRIFSTSKTDAGNSSGPDPSLSQDMRGQLPQNTVQEQTSNVSRRARAVAEWDHSGYNEKVDWYSEYIARHATLSTQWLGNNQSQLTAEIRGLDAFEQSSKAVGSLDNGAVCIWDIREPREGRRRIVELARSKEGSLLEDQSPIGQSFDQRKPLKFGGVTDCINVDKNCQKAYIAVDNVLNEVDLNTLQVISQNKYAWEITALSNQSTKEIPVTVGTSWSLHLYDPRAPFGDRFHSPEDMLRKTPSHPEDSIAFLPNYKKRELQHLQEITTNGSLITDLNPTRSVSEDWLKYWQSPKPHMSDYAHMEPGPLSILHHQENEILVAGRFPSILSYDRRYFPRLQYAIHSGARLSCLTSIPYAPKATSGTTSADSTLVACGEYGGRGSLELYSLPRDTKLHGDCSTTNESDGHQNTLSQSPIKRESPYTYKNRQEASSSKLLSVAVQGTRIVFSDAEGGLKWVERDGRGLARRWNINAWQVNERGASISGEQVARKIIPLKTTDSERGIGGDGDLLIWTGDNIGIVSTKPQWVDHEELVKSFEENPNADELKESEMADEYSKAMRRALERQADERRWMSRFRLRRGLY